MDQGSTLDVNVGRSGPPVLHIPTEVCEIIIDMLSNHPKTTTRDKLDHIVTLYSCALVCRDWRVRSQRKLFQLVRLSNSTSFHRLSTVLDTAQHLRDYVHQVDLTGYHLHYTTSIFALFPVVFAGKLPNLQRVGVVHLHGVDKYWIPRTPDPPKARSLPYIPLHSRFSTFLSSFTAVSELVLQEITFRSFAEFARMLHGLPNLEELACFSVRWITPGGAHPGADFTRQPDWAAERQTRPLFAPKVRSLWLYDIDMYAAQRLIWSSGPHLTLLVLRMPLLDGPEEPALSGGINLGSCTGLKALALFFTPEFSMDAHAGFVKELLMSWAPQHSASELSFYPYIERGFTRQSFADVLRSVSMIAEEWLQTIEEKASEGDSGTERRVQNKLVVHIRDWEAQKGWWRDHLKDSFPTWLRLGQLYMSFKPSQSDMDKWATKKQPAMADAIPQLAIEPDVNADMSSGFSKDALSPHVSDIPQSAMGAS